MGPALQAAFMVMTPLGGKLLLFQAAVPSLGAASRTGSGTCVSGDAEAAGLQRSQLCKKYALACPDQLCE